MSLAIRNVEMFHQPSRRALMERALEPHILLGMPQLTPFGLSETWLMKELGHRHWLMLASCMGMDDADFRTADGAETYAAICATSLTNAQLDRARPNQVLSIQSVLEPVSKTQVSSRHRLLVDGEAIAMSSSSRPLSDGRARTTMYRSPASSCPARIVFRCGWKTRLPGLHRMSATVVAKPISACGWRIEKSCGTFVFSPPQARNLMGPACSISLTSRLSSREPSKAGFPTARSATYLEGIASS
jgi:hypothetical protein